MLGGNHNVSGLQARVRRLEQHGPYGAARRAALADAVLHAVLAGTPCPEYAPPLTTDELLGAVLRRRATTAATSEEEPRRTEPLVIGNNMTRGERPRPR